MPRRSSRAVPASAAAPAPKRRASDGLSAASTTRTEAKKPRHAPPPTAATSKPVRTTAKRSKYFSQEPSAKSDSGSKDDDPEPESFVSANEDTEASPTPESKGSDEGSPGDEARKNRSTKQGKSGNDGRSEPEDDDAVASLKEKELWREGVKTGLGPGKEVFIKKPKARDAGDVPYQDHTLHPNTMLFLQDLAKNNDREWLKAHDPDFRAAKKDWETFVESLTEKIIDQDSTIPELPAKDIVFRIHRDIRFSKDPTPYKHRRLRWANGQQTHFSAAWSRTGRKGPYAAYYVHMQPDSCFVGSGLWNPEANALTLLREDIDQNSSRLKTVLKGPDMRREIFNGIADDEEKAVKAFVNQNKESALKIKPKGYEVDNENIQLLRLRSFTIGRTLSDTEFLSPHAQEKIAALIGIMEPFVTYLNSVVMPDFEGQSNSGSESPDESG